MKRRKKILVIAPQSGPISELSRPEVHQEFDVVFQPYQSDYYERILSTGIAGEYELRSPVEHCNDLVMLCEDHGVDGLFSPDDYPGCLYAALTAREMGFVGPNITSLLHCSHKYLSRITQQKSVPQSTPAFELISSQWSGALKKLTFPVFAKPVKSQFSVNAGVIHSAQELFHLKKNSAITDDFLFSFHWFLRNYGGADYDARDFIAEEIVSGMQVTVEGCVYKGTVTIFGVSDSIMYPNTISFAQFRYPSVLSDEVQKRMSEIAQTVIQAFYLDNTLFNIEMMYNPENDTIHIIEINPRMSSLFGDLYEKVDGINSYTAALRIAADRPPDFLHRRGPFAISSSFVMRLFEDKTVVKIPSRNEIERLTEQIPELRVHIDVAEGKKLSYYLHDDHSFRYMLIHVGGRDEQELNEKKEYCLKRLQFYFA
jgi:biotin carboxylase